MIYMANDEGVAALNSLAASLTDRSEDIQREVRMMLETVEENAYLFETNLHILVNALETIEQEVDSAGGLIVELAGKISDIADAYQEIIDIDPFSVGGGSGAGGSGGGSGAGASGGAAEGTSSASCGKTSNSFFGEAGFIPRLTTGQTIQQTSIQGRPVTVFDDPFGDHPERIINQGSAYPDDGKGNGIVGTCGLCGCGTVINRAGGHATEKSMINTAIQNGQCSNPQFSYDENHQPVPRPEDRGGTTNRNRMDILADAGIATTDRTGASLSDLAADVESGHGVMISVVASAYKEDWYGTYSEDNAGTHVLIIDSVVRDAQTQEIIGYVVSDSYGSSSAEAGVFVSADHLQDACDASYNIARSTDEVIW